jgi:hypothetical protein
MFVVYYIPLASVVIVFQNPLQFSFPPGVDAESLMQGAEQLSKAVLQSGMIQN